ncbi:uncharacterized protein LOC144640429 [Oculina patagonica]
MNFVRLPRFLFEELIVLWRKIQSMKPTVPGEFKQLLDQVQDKIAELERQSQGAAADFQPSRTAELPVPTEASQVQMDTAIEETPIPRKRPPVAMDTAEETPIPRKRPPVAMDTAVLAQAHEETRHMVPPSVIPAIQEEGKVLNSIFQNVFSSCEEK